jgi:hypothetical protein
MTMTTAPTRIVRGLLGGAVIPVLLAGCTAPSHPAAARPHPSQGQGFRTFTVTKTGGFAGVDERIDVGADGTVRNGAGRDVGRIRPADLAELHTILAGKEIRAEAAARPRPGAGNRCIADGFTFTLVMGALRISECSSSRPSNNPAFHRVIELTSGNHVQTR